MALEYRISFHFVIVWKRLENIIECMKRVQTSLVILVRQTANQYILKIIVLHFKYETIVAV